MPEWLEVGSRARLGGKKEEQGAQGGEGLPRTGRGCKDLGQDAFGQLKSLL